MRKRPAANLSPTRFWQRQRAFLRREALCWPFLELLAFALLAGFIDLVFAPGR